MTAIDSQNANPWAELADRPIPSPRKARQRAAERVAAATKERTALQRAWAAWRQERVEELCSGPLYGEAARALRDFLEKMEIKDGGKLIAAVKAGPWASADPDTKHEILRLVDTAIVRLRERNDLPPFDDAVPFTGRPLTVFQIIRETLR
jgi:hypothetical protein